MRLDRVLLRVKLLIYRDYLTRGYYSLLRCNVRVGKFDIINEGILANVTRSEALNPPLFSSRPYALPEKHPIKVRFTTDR